MKILTRFRTLSGLGGKTLILLMHNCRQAHIVATHVGGDADVGGFAMKNYTSYLPASLLIINFVIQTGTDNYANHNNNTTL